MRMQSASSGMASTVSRDRVLVSMLAFSIWSAKVEGSSASPWPSRT